MVGSGAMKNTAVVLLALYGLSVSPGIILIGLAVYSVVEFGRRS